ncbi:hypothetical protein [Azospirillum sp. A39]|uniref:hypothetical protein n=1 Tax=Azospirillum sp. A39 TaxID=3462279 RepID=UPI004045953A
MRLHSDPARFSITAFLADQVALVARHERLSPGAALLRLRELSQDQRGRRSLLAMVAAVERQETDPVEAGKIAAVRREMAAWMEAAAE